MNKIILTIFIVITGCNMNNSRLEEPKANKIDKVLSIHGDDRVDEYYWLSNRGDSNVIDYLNSEEWVKNLSKLTEINDIFPVTSTNEHLANYHEMRESGNLAPHVDHSHEPVIGKPHVLNIIIYLSDDWDEKLGGNTLLYDEKGKKIKIKIPYKKNRAIIFLHTPYSFHGVEKITNTTNSIRKTIYVDYYSKSLKPFDNLNLNISKKWFKHGTTFIFQNKLDYLKPKNISYTKTFFRYKISEILSKFT